MTEPTSDIAEGIVQDTPPEHIALPRTTFRAWHKVRKQFIRKHQWNELARRNVNDSWRAELQRPSAIDATAQSLMHVSRPLRCLVIPGDDLLDVRALWNEISALDCFIHYLGFNEGHGSSEIGTDVYVANNAVTSLAGVLPSSQVLRDRFEAIAAPTSVAYKYLREYGPYHIVNLDLCGSMFPNTAQDVTPYFTAVNRLLEYQYATQKTNWLLFITTMVEPSVVDIARMQQLCKPTMENVASNPAFADKMAGLLPRDRLQNQTHLVDLTGLSDAQLVRLFGVALGKWLLRMGQSPSPKWTVGMRRSFQYTINKQKNAVLLSLAFDMIPNFAPPVDGTGMSNLDVNVKEFPTEVECAVKLAESVFGIADVDGRLAADGALKANLCQEAADLLASAGYDRNAFLQWVEAGEPTNPN